VGSSLELDELRTVLEAEIARLPERYREPMELCYLQGMTNAEAAQEMGCPSGTVKGWLARARKLLRSRLARRGLTLFILRLALVLAAEGAVQLARTMTTCAGPCGAISFRVAAVPAEVLQPVAVARWKFCLGVRLLLGLLTGMTGIASAVVKGDQDSRGR
jgi:hypothetical protein